MQKKMHYFFALFLFLNLVIIELSAGPSYFNLYQEEIKAQITPLAVFTPSESSELPGVMVKLNSDENRLEHFFWKLTYENPLLPAQFRESSRPIFYFPAAGHYTLEAFATDAFGNEINCRLDLEVSRTEVTFTYEAGEIDKIVFSLEQFASPADIWNLLELTGSSSKPTGIFGQAWYVIAGGGAVGAFAYALWPEKEEKKPSLIANDVEVQITCPSALTIFPLENDQGENIFIKSVNGLSEEIGRMVPPDRIEIYKGLNRDLILAYTIADENGMEATANITIRASLPELQLNDINVQLNAGESARLNLLENAVCSNCRILELEQPLSGSFSLEDDVFNYSSDAAFGGNFSLNFIVEDECGQIAVASIFIEINPICKAEFTFEKKLADCGLNNGQLEVLPVEDGNYSFSWENGAVINRIDEIGTGDYQLTVTDDTNGCEYELLAYLEEEITEYIRLLATNPGNCLKSADAELELKIPLPGVLIMTIEGDEVNETTEITLSENLNTTLSQLWNGIFWTSGSYQLEIYQQEAGIRCIQTLELILAEVPTELRAVDDEFSVAAGLPLSGNILENDQGTGLKVIAFEAPQFGNLTIEENGDVHFQSLEDETGEIRVEYEVMDSCGYSDLAFLIIEVFPCILSLELKTEDTACGQATGSAEVKSADPENYDYDWSESGEGVISEGLTAGSYSVLVTETESGCSELLEFEIYTLPPISARDSFSVFTNDTLTGNLLINDQGFELKVIEFGPFTDASLLIDADGGFTYISAVDFIGQEEYWYLIEDACGGRDSGILIINVLPLSCIPDISILADSVRCGLSEAMVVVTVEADCEYNILWHNDADGDTLFNQTAGTYEVLIITGGDAFELDTFILSYTIFEKKPEYIQGVEKTNPNCFENGTLILDLDSPGEGDFKIIIEGPHGRDTVFTSEKVVSLGDEVELIIGEYLIIVQDRSLECDLADSLSILLVTDPLILELVDDSISMFSGSSVSVDLFTNDTGIGLKLISIDQPPFGMLNLNFDGKGTYSVSLPDHGIFTLTYSATDTCGQEASALLVIEVRLPPCEFEVQFITLDSDCGYDNGSISTSISPSGSYTYLWNNGAEEKNITGLSPGNYTLTVTDELRICDLEFSQTVVEKDSDWLQNLSVVPEGCAHPADIILDLNAAENDELVITINGGEYNNFQITVPQGTVSLNDYIGLTAGTYFLDVLPVGSQSYCTETTSAQITLSPNPVSFTVTQTIPPSAPNLFNGQISIDIIGGFTDYELLLNGEFYASTSQNSYTFTNLGQGTYEIEVIDAQNCSGGTQVVNLHVAGSFQFAQNFSPGPLSISPIFSSLKEFEIIEHHQTAETKPAYYHQEFVQMGVHWTARKNWMLGVEISRIASLSMIQLSNSGFLSDDIQQTAVRFTGTKIISSFNRPKLVIGGGGTLFQTNRKISIADLGTIFDEHYFDWDISALLRGGLRQQAFDRMTIDAGFALEYFPHHKFLQWTAEIQLKYELGK